MKILNIGMLFILVTGSCTYHKETGISPERTCQTTVLIPDSISFQKNILPVFNKNCSNPGCHSGKFPKGKLNLEQAQAYAQLSKKGSGFIDTVQPSFSLLYSALVSTNTPMPPSGPLEPCYKRPKIIKRC
jgi:hypothetical protein